MRHRSALILLSLGGLAASGCLTTYELSPVPPGHPASPSAPEATVERSATLAEADPVDPRPARSERWARPSEDAAPHEHDHQHDTPEHQAMEPDRPHEHPTPPAAEAPAADGFDGQLTLVLDAYFDTAEALAGDDLEAANRAMERLQGSLEGVEPELLDANQRETWLAITAALDRPVRRFLDAPGIEAARTAFGTISEKMIEAVRELGSEALAPVHLLHCPMAFGGRGAHWLQPTEEVSNPYYGAAMLRCGSVEETLVGDLATEPGDEDGGHDHHHGDHDRGHGHHHGSR